MEIRGSVALVTGALVTPGPESWHPCDARPTERTIG